MTPSSHPLPRVEIFEPMGQRKLDKAEARRLHSEGVPHRDIAKKFDVALSTVYRAIPGENGSGHVEFDVERCEALLKTGSSYREAAEQAGVSEITVRVRIPGYGKMAQSEAKNEKTREMFHAGASDAEIAQEIGSTAESVRHRRIRLGLKRQEYIPPIDEEEAERIRSYLEEGYSIHQVVEIVGRSPKALYTRFPEYVLSPTESGERAMLARWGNQVLEKL